MEVPKVPRLPRKSRLGCCQYHACLARSSGAKSVPIRRRASADIYGGAERTTPATQIEAEVLQVSRLPRKIQRRQIGPHSSHILLQCVPPGLLGEKVQMNWGG